MTPENVQPKSFKGPSFWIGPMLFGACFTLGYGITSRIMILKGSNRFLIQEAFAVEPFPGERLEDLRLRHGGLKIDLQLDISSE